MSGFGPKVSKAGGGTTGPQPVIIVGGGQITGDTVATDVTRDLYFEAPSVAAGIETNIMNYIVPLTPIFQLVRFEFGGTNIGQFFLYFDNVRVNQYITWFNGSGLTGDWSYKSGIPGGIDVGAGVNIKLTCLHNRPFLGDFYSRMIYVLIN